MEVQNTEEMMRKARRRAMHLLERMNRSEKALRQKLDQGEYSEEAIESAIAYVKSFGYLNDQRYAESYLAGRLTGKSKKVLFQELSAKGVDKETVQLAWEEVTACQKVDERQIIEECIRKKCPQGGEISEREYRRLVAFLARRGFSHNDIFAVMESEGISLRKNQ